MIFLTQLLNGSAKMARLHVFMMFVLMALAACMPPRGIMDEVEEQSGTGTVPIPGTNLRTYHLALLDRSGVHLDYPGYLVGVEYLAGSSTPSVTHIMNYAGSPGYAPQVVFQNFNEGVQIALPSSRECPPPPDNGAIDAIAESINRDLRETEGPKPKYTHLLVMVMGWNTDQAESVRNFNQLATNIQLATHTVHATEGQKDFRPLVIGVSWPSTWKLNGWWIIPDAVVSASSFWAKKDQADQLGRRVLAPLLINAVLKARSELFAKIPVVVIGHSFGARALSAVFRPWESAFRGVVPWDRDSCYKPEPNAFSFRDGDRLILLQGAVDISDVIGNDSILPALLRTDSLTAIMTASQFDSAVPTAFWANYIGNIETFRQACGESAKASPDYDLGSIGCGDAVSDQWGLQRCRNTAEMIKLDSSRQSDRHKIYYKNASRLINCRTPLGGGAAHSDIFRPETGSFLWNQIRVPPGSNEQELGD